MKENASERKNKMRFLALPQILLFFLLVIVGFAADVLFALPAKSEIVISNDDLFGA
jgi:hypothetical protein